MTPHSSFPRKQESRGGVLARVALGPRFRARACTDPRAQISPFPPWGADRVGVRWGEPQTPIGGTTHLTPPSPPQAGGEGQKAPEIHRARNVCIP